MTSNLLFLPVLVQILLTFGLYIYLAVAKSRASAQGLVDENRRGLHDDAWPESVMKINNCIRNQFEVPVLFYVLVLATWASAAVTVYSHVLAWLFVASRVVHAFIHTGSNIVPVRRKVFMVGVLILLTMTIMLTYRVLTA